MLTKEQRTSLEQVIEGLNQLYDRDVTVPTVHSLLAHTVTLFRGSTLAESFDLSIARLQAIMDLNVEPEMERGLGLEMTDDLQKIVAAELRRDAEANPRRRHVPRAK